MKEFISEIRKIDTASLIYEFSNISIQMYNSRQHMLDVEIPVVRYGKLKKKIVKLSAWDIPNIAYYSVKESNDYRQAKKKSTIEELVDLYRDFEEEDLQAESMGNSDLDGVFRIILGMTTEQFQHQRLNLVFERFSRDYYILLAAQDFEHREEINVNAVTKKIFGWSADDYLAILLIVFWLCSQNPIPLSVSNNKYCGKVNTIFTSENIKKLVEYYSCTYDELRKTPFGKQRLYSKPFVKTQKKGLYLSVSVFLIMLTVSNGLYWLVRDYYCERGTQKFVNAFGLLFEDYVKDIASNYCKQEEYQKLPAGSQKGADFLFDFGIVQMLVEAKSSILRLDVRQQLPNLDSVDNFYDNTIKEAYVQLNSSYEQLKGNGNVPILKVILLYDEFSNTAIIESAMQNIFEADLGCFVMTIRELEILLYIHKHDTDKQRQIFEKLLDKDNLDGHRKNIGAIYKELKIFENLHLEGEMDYFVKLLEHYKEYF